MKRARRTRAAWVSVVWARGPRPLGLVLVLPLVLAACDEPLPPTRQVEPELASFVIAFLETIQPPSIAENLEYCGYLGLDPAGDWIATPPVEGTVDSCLVPNWPSEMTVVASYHSHAGFDTDSDSEVPSTDDLLADIEEGVDGFVSTPGGRVWFLDHEAQTATQLCPLDCVLSDPAFIEGDEGVIAPSYTLKELRA
ncbi:MAG: DUF4329 domain-containing protein, partial [Pseudomonadota bacterium]